MAKAKVFGSITITDVTDVGRLSVYLTSNQPQTVIEDPNSETTTYTPDWSKNNLVLTPIIYFNDEQLQLPKTGLTVTWKRQEGSSPAANLGSGEIVSDGVLKVSQNFLGSISSGLLTYIANIQYTVPNTNATLETQAQMSFSLSKQATEAKYCSILGESVFLYNTSQSLVGSDTIALTASLTNVSVTQWQYKSATGEFVAMPTTNNPSINGSTIKIKASESILFNNDVAVIKLVTNDSSVYDLHTITKIRDGAAGNSTVAVVLSNDSHTLPCNSKGVIGEGGYNGAETEISVSEGGTDVTSEWSVDAVPSEGVTGKLEGHKYTVTKMENNIDVGHVEFTCTKLSTTLKKRFTLIKQKAGMDGSDAVIYSLKASALSMNLSKTNAFSPSNVTFSASKQVGAETTSTTYSGRFKIYESNDGLDFATVKYTSSVDEISKSYTPSNTSIRAIKCELYASGGTTVLLDSQTVVITRDGGDGQNGHDGDGGISIGMSNDAEVIPCNSNGTVKVQKEIHIPFYAYKGIKRVAVTCVPGSLPSGVTVRTNTAGTVNADGLLVINIPAGNNLGSASDLSGNFTLSFKAEGVTIERKFGWTKSIQATNSILLQIFAPQGDVIINGKNSVVLETQLTDGSTIVKDGITYQWSKFTSGSYQNIPSATKDKLTVTPDMVESLASFKCTANYGGKQYVAYWTVTDKNDPIDLVVLSSVGTQLTNETSFGVVYALAYLNGKEVDPIKTTVFSTSAPKSAQTGDFYYHIDKSEKTVTLKKHNGSIWQDAAGDDLPKGTYKYYRRSNGVELDTSAPWKQGKVIFIDREIVNKNLVINCEADINI